VSSTYVLGGSNLANNYGDVKFDDVTAGAAFQNEQEASGNVAASQQMASAMAQAQGPESVQKFFEKERNTSRRAAALDEAKAQTQTMKKAMNLQATNFDESLKNQRRLYNLDKNATQTLVEGEKQFQLDAAGRKFLSERQMADWFATKAQGEEDWAGYQQRTTQLHERKLQILQAAYKQLEMKETQLYQAGAAAQDRDTREFLARAKSSLEAKIRKAQAQSANSTAIIGALSTAATIVGTVYGGPAVGIGAGTAVSAAGSKYMTNNQEEI
jgi:hypothetical protein